LREPLPAPLKTSSAYATEILRMNGEDQALAAARRAWTSDKFPGEDADAAHAVVWGLGAPLELLLEQQPAADERWSGQPTRLAEISVRLWGPMLQHRRDVSL